MRNNKAENKPVEILIVEDSPTQAEKLQYILGKKGYRVIAAPNGKMALEILNSNLPDIVISDIVMPEMDGYELCKRLRADERFKYIPVILVTTLTDPKDVIKGLECGANNFIVKPYDERYLVSRIQYLIANYELRKDTNAEMGINVFFSGENYFITAERLQILDLLLSTYENAYYQNIELIEAQNKLRNTNEWLEEMVRERTAELVDTNMRIQLELVERKRAEEALQSSEIRYRRLFESAKDGILILDADTGVIADINPFLLEMLGYSQTELLGKRLWDIGELKDAGLSKDSYSKLQRDGYIRYEDLPLVTKDKRSIDVEFVSNSYYVDHKKVIQCNIRDVTERKRAERALDRLKNQYGMILQSAGEGIIGEDAKGRITFANPAAEIMFSYGAGELIGRSGHTTWHHSKRDGGPYPEEECPITKACRAGKTYSGIDEVFWRKDGTKFPIDYIATPIREGDALTGIVVIFRDITQGKLYQEAEVARISADAANKAKSDFLANMSHELRTPLNAVIGFSEILEDELYGKLNERQQDYVKNIYGSGKHLLYLINDILDLSKVEAGKMELELSRFLIEDELNTSITMLKEKAMKHRIKLDCVIDPDAGIEIEADERRLKQVLFNLLSNAVKFTPEGGSVRVAARRVGSQESGVRNNEVTELRTQRSELDRDFIEISVADTGVGIKPEDIEKLFKPFSQLESAYTKNIEGTGLGLALTRRLVDLHQGRIWVESEFGKGSKFSFAIPIRQESAGRSREPECENTK